MDHHAALQTLGRRPGFKYVSRNIDIKSHQHVDIIWLVRRDPTANELEELVDITARRKRRLFYVIDPSQELKHTFNKDAEIENEYRLYVQTVTPPWDLNDFRYREWIARLIIPHVVLSASKFEWNGVKPNILFKHSKTSQVATLMRVYWNDVKTSVKEDIKRIMQHKGSFFCLKCTPNCPLNGVPSHITMHKFMEMKFSDNPIQTGIFTQLRLFGSGRPDGDELLLDLNRLHSGFADFSPANIKSITDTIDVKGPANAPEFHCCYILLILQGPNMPEADEDLYLEEEQDEEQGVARTRLSTLMADKRIHKFIYVGVTKGKTFRDGHLYDESSPVRQILTTKARMIVLRQYITPSRVDANLNEAYIIELLKTINTRKVDRMEELDYFLVNQASSPACLVTLDVGHVMDILDFVATGKPIFTSSSNFEEETKKPDFTGEYGVGKMVPFEENDYALHYEVEYKNIQKIVDVIIFRNVNARWFNFRV